MGDGQVTLVRTTDENGDEVLECEKDSRGRYVWNPSPEVFARYEQRERLHAYINVAGRLIQEATRGNGWEGLNGRTLVVKSEPGRGFLSYLKHSGGVPEEEHAHTRATMARTVARFRFRGP